MKLKELNARNPFILPYDGKYYLYYNALFNGIESISVLVSDDLVEWNQSNSYIISTDDFIPDASFVYPSVIHYNGKFYLAATHKIQNGTKSIYMFVSDTPDGEFTLHSKEPLTPPNWNSIFSCIYFNKEGIPYLVFSHEWIQIQDGAVCSVELSKDLSKAVGTPRTLFSASSCKIVKTVSQSNPAFVTDAPYIFRKDDETLFCAWSTITTERYAVIVSKSDNGEIDGNWMVCDEPFAMVNGGCGMFFEDFSGKWHYVMHKPNVFLAEKAVIYDFINNDDKFHIVE